MQRTAIPLHRKRQKALIEHLDPRKNTDNNHKQVATHLLLGTGMRNNTCGHTHKFWFEYVEGELYIQIPGNDKCRKDTSRNISGDVCWECKGKDEPKPFNPKTPRSEGRMIHIGNYYHDYCSGEKRYFGLRDRVESYFAISPPDDQGPAIGFDMIQADNCDGVSVSALAGWVRDVCTEAGISAAMREKRLTKELGRVQNEGDEPIDEKIADNGKDKQGRPIPDIFPHDLRATYCTQLCRCKNPNYSEIKAKTGHKNEETLYRYVGYAGNELDPKRDATLF